MFDSELACCRFWLQVHGNGGTATMNRNVVRAAMRARQVQTWTLLDLQFHTHFHSPKPHAGCACMQVNVQGPAGRTQAQGRRIVLAWRQSRHPRRLRLLPSDTFAPAAGARMRQGG